MRVHENTFIEFIVGFLSRYDNSNKLLTDLLAFLDRQKTKNSQARSTTSRNSPCQTLAPNILDHFGRSVLNQTYKKLIYFLLQTFQLYSCWIERQI